MQNYSRKGIVKAFSQNITYKKSLFIIILTGLLTVPISFISPYLFGILVDDVMGSREFQKFKYVVIGLLAVYLLRFIFDGIRLYYSNTLLNRFTFNIRNKIWKKYINIKYEDYEKKDIGDLKMRLYDDIDVAGNFFHEQIADYILNIFMIIFMTAVTFYINYKLAIICLIVVPLVIITNKAIGNGFNKINEETRKAMEEYFNFEHNSLQFWKEIKALNAEENFINKFKIHRKLLAELGYKWIKYWFFQESFNDFKSNYLTKILVYIAGAFFVINNEISVGELVAFSEYFAMLFSNIDGLNGKSVNLRINKPYYERIIEILNENPEEDKETKKYPQAVECIEMNNISFRYSDDRNCILSNLNMEINRGDYISIEGRSGCGKTTLIKLIINLYNPSNGEILYNKKFISNNMNIDYSSLGTVMQNNYLFNISIKENLLLARRHASLKELEEACRKSNILDFIQSLPNGFDTVIGENGIKLSGGQRQRLAIAQAILKEPKMIVLDEATSSLDNISENVITKSIETLSENMVFIIISHNPNMIFKAKKIYRMEQGGKIAVIKNQEKSYE